MAHNTLVRIDAAPPSLSPPPPSPLVAVSAPPHSLTCTSTPGAEKTSPVDALKSSTYTSASQRARSTWLSAYASSKLSPTAQVLWGLCLHRGQSMLLQPRYLGGGQVCMWVSVWVGVLGEGGGGLDAWVHAMQAVSCAHTHGPWNIQEKHPGLAAG